MRIFRNKIYVLSPNMLLLLKLAMPIIGSSLLIMAFNLTDMIWVGKLGSNSVAAVGTAGFFINLSWALSSLVVMGSSVKISHMIGAKDMVKSGKYASNGLIGVAVMSVIYSSFLYITAPQLIGFFALDSQEVIDMSVSYLRISAFGVVINMINILLIGIINAHGLTKLSFKLSFIGTLTNIILDPLFIFYFKLGIDGAAIASIIAHTLTLSLFTIHIRKNQGKYFGRIRLIFNNLKEQLKIGLPTSIQRVSFILISIVLARIIAEWGHVAIAVQKIGVQIESITFMLTGGLTQAMTIAVGQQFGAENYDKIKGIYREGLKLSVAIGMVTTTIFLVVPDILFRVFVNETETITMGADYLRILAISQIFMCLEMITAGAFNGLGRTDITAKVSVIFTGLRVPMAYLLAIYTILELNGVWFSITISSIFKGIILFLLFRSIFRKVMNRQKTL
ncbi:MAG: MATE family efflux transporter [Bacteroidales bacterium]|nr:MATE family efflux transporter [Bacteroidales bacterium]